MNESKKLKEKLLLSMLTNVPFDGWSWQALYTGAEDIKLFENDFGE